MSDESPGRHRFMLIAFVVVGITSFVALIAMVATGIAKVNTGHGLDTFRTSWLIEFNWVGFLVLTGGVIVALIGGGYLRYLEWRELRKLQHRYRGEGHDV
jgi:hypothetical protein